MLSFEQYINEAIGKSPITPELMDMLGITPEEKKHIDAVLKGMFQVIANDGASAEEQAGNANNAEVADSLFSEEEPITEGKLNAKELTGLFKDLLTKKAKKGGQVKAKIQLLILCYKGLQKIDNRIKPDAIRAFISAFDTYEKDMNKNK